LAERVRKKIESLILEYEGQRIQCTVSLGVTQARSEDDIDGLIKRADEALYVAKERGKNRVCMANGKPGKFKSCGKKEENSLKGQSLVFQLEIQHEDIDAQC
jgi:predicted signal transduction protein with EAL and GGDEF domain